MDTPLERDLDLRGPIETCLDAAIALTSAQKGNIQLFDEVTGTFRIFVHRGFDEQFLKFFESISAESVSPCGSALRAGARIVVEDVLESPIFKGTSAQKILLDSNVRAFQSTPLVNRSARIAGMLSTHFEHPRQLMPTECQVLDVLARQATDLIERFAAEKVLKQAEAKLVEQASLLNLTSDAIIVRDETGKIRYWNSGAEALYGWSAQEAIGQITHDLLQTKFPEYLPVIEETIRKAKHWNGELVHTCKNRKKVFVSSRWDLFYTEDTAQTPSIMEINTDVTEAKQAHEALQRNEKRLRSLAIALDHRVRERTQELTESVARTHYQAELLDAANDAIFVRDRYGEINYWNKGAERLYGWTKEEAIGKTVPDLLKTEFPAPVEQIMEQSEHSSWEGELVHWTKDGKQLNVASRWTPLKDDRGKTIGWLTINTDITKHKQDDEALRQLGGDLLKSQDEERRRIARDLHDSAGQTLVSLAMSLEQLGDANMDQRQIGLLNNSVRLVEEVTKQIRTISYLLHPPLLDELGLASALHFYVEGFEKRSGIKTTLELPDDFGRLSQEVEIALFRVVQESLTNVHRHSGSGTAVIRLQRSESEVIIEVADHGDGIGRPRIDSPGTSSMGVGLLGMRERITQLGGDLKLQSGSKGTTVMAVLPIATPSSLQSVLLS